MLWAQIRPQPPPPRPKKKLKLDKTQIRNPRCRKYDEFRPEDLRYRREYRAAEQQSAHVPCCACERVVIARLEIVVCLPGTVSPVKFRHILDALGHPPASAGKPLIR